MASSSFITRISNVPAQQQHLLFLASDRPIRWMIRLTPTREVSKEKRNVPICTYRIDDSVFVLYCVYLKCAVVPLVRKQQQTIVIQVPHGT